MFPTSFIFAGRALKPGNSLIVSSNLSRWMYSRTTDYRLRFCEAALFISSGGIGQKEDHRTTPWPESLDFNLELESRFRDLSKFIFTVWALTKTCYFICSVCKSKSRKLTLKRRRKKSPKWNSKKTYNLRIVNSQCWELMVLKKIFFFFIWPFWTPFFRKKYAEYHEEPSKILG